MEKKYVIIGGGVAGLAAACRLVERGEVPLILEASGAHPSHKICGEFFSPECLKSLADWGIEFSQTIEQILYATPNSTWMFDLPGFGGTMSHLSFDQKLLDYAKRGGSTLRLNSPAEAIKPFKNGYLITTPTEEIFATHLFVAAGRLPFLSTPRAKPKYLGFKAYFSDIKLAKPLMMFSFKRGYVGVSEVERGIYNVAGLTAEKDLPFERWKEESPLFKETFSSAKIIFPDWLKTPVPDFGQKKIPHLKNVYFIGDAAFTLPPATGAGLSNSLCSGSQAADFALKNNHDGYNLFILKGKKRKNLSAHFMHQVLMRPHILKLGPYFPSITQRLYSWTRAGINL